MKRIIQLLIFLSLVFSEMSIAQPNCSAVATGLVPINDLGGGLFINAWNVSWQGGLYPNGSNILPPEHKNRGLELAGQVQCLDSGGNPDAVNGKIVWLSIGMSNTTQETQQFIPQANAYAGKNPRLKLVDGAVGGMTASIISTQNNSNYTTYWNTVKSRLSSAGVTADQVQIIWLKEANSVGSTPIKQYYDSLVVQLKRITFELKTRFPNVKLCYMASRISARYATSNLNPEPFAYYTGWAVKKVIEDQINGDAQLKFTGTDAKSPWLSWGIYMWSDGDKPQQTDPSVFWSCPNDFQSDGTHPSNPVGAAKAGKLLLSFFTTDDTAKPWFLGNGCQIVSSADELIAANDLQIFPNPFKLETQIKSRKPFQHAAITIINSMGQQVGCLTDISGESFTLRRDHLPAGLYILQLSESGKLTATSKVLITD
jgi:hypothetical protein